MPITPAPIKDKPLDDTGYMSMPWAQWLVGIYEALRGWKRSRTDLISVTFANTLAQIRDDQIITLPGVRVGDTVVLTQKAAYSGAVFTAYVAAEDTLVVRQHNYSASTILSQTFDFSVTTLRQ